MAYAFEATANALRQNQDDPQQTNIFQAPSGQQQSGSARRSDSVQASDAGGDLSGGTDQSSGAVATAQAPASGSSAAQNRVMGANQGKVKNPVAEGMQSRISQASQGLQDEANNYEKAATQPYSTPSAQYGDVDAYVNAGTEPTGTWKTDLLRGNAGQVDAFAPKTDTSFAFTSSGDASPAHTPIPEMLQSDAGIRQLMRQGQAQDAEYNTNDAALDTALLRKDQGFNQTRDALINGANSLRDQKNKLTASDDTGESAVAQKAREAAYKGWQSDLQGHIKSDADAITASDTAQSKAFNDAMQNLQAGDPAARQAQIDTYLAQMKLDPGYDPNIKAEFGGFVAGDQNQYFDNSTNPVATTGNDFVTQDQIGQFQRVNDLLLGNGPSQSLVGQYAGKSAQDVYKDNFNNQKYSSDLLNFAKGQATQQAAINASKAQAQAAAQAYQDQQSTAAQQTAYDAAAGRANSTAADTSVDQIRNPHPSPSVTNPLNPQINIPGMSSQPLIPKGKPAFKKPKI